MFDFTKSRGEKVILRANGTVASAVMQPVG
jgi:hypothetical protein